MSQQVSIAIIGGGASGTITALHLMRKLYLPAHVTIIEKRSEALYRGHAYSSTLNYEPLNVPAGRMSVFSHLPDDFYFWLKKNKQPFCETEITKDSFVSRRWYGDYLAERVANATQQASHITFETVCGEVSNVDFDTEGRAYVISLGGEHKLCANYLIFATGNEPPADVFNPAEVAGLNGHYISNPWATNPFNGIQANDDVLIIGTGLTMVDHVVSLHKRRHLGKVYCFSRNGYLPLPHTATTQNYVFDFRGEQKQLTGIFSEIRKNVANAQRKDIQWQNTLDAMRGKTSRMWKLMDINARKLFLKRLRTFWEIHRHRMPIASAEILNGMMDTGQLHILSGSSNGVEVHGDTATFKYISRPDKQERSVSVKRIINCTGPSGDYYKTGNTLFKNLLAKGWMKQDELKLGIVTGVRGEIIKQNGVVLQNAFSIGPIRKATEWETTAIREIRTQAEETASFISSGIELKHEVAVEIGL